LIVTVTGNTGLDHVYFLPELRWGARNAAERKVTSMGAKGADVSMILAALGEATLATGFLAGVTGAEVERLLRAAGAETEFVPVRGDSRPNLVLVETATGNAATIVADTLEADRADAAALDDLLARRLGPGDILVVAGSAPAGVGTDFHARLVRNARARGLPVVLDVAGAPLPAGLAAGPSAVKPNRHEAGALLGLEIATTEEAIAAARELRARGAEWVLLSRDRDGALLATAEGVWHAPPAPVQVVSAAGAGDGMTSALALGLQHGWAPEETLRWATAIAGAVCLMPGTAECRREDVESLLPRVTVTRVA
jgi:1-phosphofructokinase family hexose kinase